MTQVCIDLATKFSQIIKILMKANSQENSYIKYNNSICLRSSRECNNHKMFIEFIIMPMLIRNKLEKVVHWISWLKDILKVKTKEKLFSI